MEDSAKTIEEAGRTATELVTTQDRLAGFWHHYRQHSDLPSQQKTDG